eukprot:Seg2991.2 transcript_id=Seg2991.2/GoldUCD/mRNA.D3Y31 product="hypothetical protein" protein_id=Seg2991.2/GoldUCD/D3Y31
MGNYMRRYAALFPGDWPAQFHVRKAVNRKCNFDTPHHQPTTISTNSSTGVREESTEDIHFHTYGHPSSSSVSSPYDLTDLRGFDDPLQAAVPLIGPLCVSFNSREDVMQNVHPFFKFVYELLFPKQKLADKPIP